MTQLWKPVLTRFSGSTANGSGSLNRGTYTVPAGKRATLRHVYLQCSNNANAVNTTFTEVYITIAGSALTQIASLNGSGLANVTYLSYSLIIDLLAADTVQLFSTNNGANSVSMAINCIVREYL